MANGPTSATPPMLRDLNERTVLETIRAHAPISRAEISRRVGISKPTVSQALRSLLEAGLVREAELDGDGPSYGATFFEPVAEAALVLGLDLGARFLRAAICDLRGEVRARQDVDTGGRDVLELLDTAAELKERLLAASGLEGDAIERVVLGVPGVIHTGSMRVHLAENVPGLEGRAIGADLEERFGVRGIVENDVNLAAVGERWRGVARGVDDFAFLSVGTGLGAGIVLAGELRAGRNGAAGELDFAHPGGGAGDADPSAPALAEFAERAGAGRDIRAIFAAARSGDAAAEAVVAEEARRIALYIAPLSAVADVELVVVGGGIGANGDLLLAPIREQLAELLPFPPRVEVSSLGDAAVLTGALGVGLRAALDSVFANRGRR
ncbi:MAG: ROK family protein [Thermoleophilaceae bacterium]